MRDIIWGKQYAASKGETYEEGLKRVALAVAEANNHYNNIPGKVQSIINKEYNDFFKLMNDNDFLPGGRVLAGAGSNHGNLLNCFVVDSEEEGNNYVMDIATKIALITKVGGGVGVNLDKIPQRQKRTYELGNLLIFTNGTNHKPGELKSGTYYSLVHGKDLPHNYRYATVTETVPKNLDNYEVIKVPDSIEGIWESAKRMITLLDVEYNVAIDLSALRSAGTPVVGSGGDSSGPVSFAVEVFDSWAYWLSIGGFAEAGPVAALRYVFAPTLRVIRCGGTRRGAGMATMNVENPDREDFLTAKDLHREAAEGAIDTYNISFLATDKFMTSTEESDIGFLKRIAKHAHGTGEPGIIFVDVINNNNAALETQGRIVCTNPCGEIPLYPGEPCDLGALNLSNFITTTNGESAFDTERFKKAVHTAIKFLDNVLTISKPPLPEIEVAINKNRRLGLGVMGLADLLVRLGIKYGSEEATILTSKIFNIMAEESRHMSWILGNELGVPEGPKLAGLDRRNIATLTVAPTGTTSMLAGVSSGIEPIFSAVTFRRVGDEYHTIIHPLLKEILSEVDSSLDINILLDEIQQHDGSITWLADRYTDSRLSAFLTAHDIHPLAHVAMQAAAQRSMDSVRGIGNSISKTINMPETATEEDVYNAYKTAYGLGCKGITVYRNNSRQLQVLNTKEVKEETSQVPISDNSEVKVSFVTRDKVSAGNTHKVKIGTRSLYITVNRNKQGDIVEVFINASRPTPNESTIASIIGRLISVSLKHGASIEEIIYHLSGHMDDTGGMSQGRGYIGSIWSSVASVLSDEINVEVPPIISDTQCTECKSEMVREEGCWKCYGCGYSKCG